MEIKCNRGFYCIFYCLLNMFRASLRPSSGAQEYYTVVAACGISCCKNVKNNFVSFCGICVLNLKSRVLSRFVTRCVECRGGRVWLCIPRKQIYIWSTDTIYLSDTTDVVNRLSSKNKLHCWRKVTNYLIYRINLQAILQFGNFCRKIN